MWDFPVVVSAAVGDATQISTVLLKLMRNSKAQIKFSRVRSRSPSSFCRELPANIQGTSVSKNRFGYLLKLAAPKKHILKPKPQQGLEIFKRNVVSPHPVLLAHAYGISTN